ncbi:3-alpha-hydroxysteroid dehydrogenase [Sphingomonas sp. DBB INV C78]|uniref:SDR family NAD(P)-dependent oxidoreductase n=1 Tax=Sphingomonas sp. DBB INV C78 TaxID=3349434 RepID=UPI0036D2DA26
MMIDLKGKVALVTGAASAEGLGFAAALKMAGQGARLFLTDLNAEGVEARAADLRAAGHEAQAMGQDVTDEAAWAATIDAVVSAFGRIDILVNNAGIAVLKMMSEMTKADWDRQLRVNLDSVYLGCKAGLDQMRKQGGGGSIVNLSSIAGLVGVPGTAAYAASKGGVRLMTKAIALEAAREGIRVNSVHPGSIWTDMQKVAIADNKEQFDIIENAIPMGHLGQPEDIGAMVAFLASDDAKYITGAEFTVDGGMTAQ